MAELSAPGGVSVPPYPKVLVLMATRNGSRFLGGQLQSIADQRGVEVTLRVLDDGSSDDTVSILRNFAGALDLEILQARSRLGLPGAFLRLLDTVTTDGQFVAFADQDDIWEVEKLTTALVALRRSRATLWFSDVDVIDDRGNRLRQSPAPLQPSRLGFGNALIQSPRPGCAMVFVSDLLPHLQDVDPRRIVMHDSWLYLCASAFGSVVSDPRRLISYRVHDSNALGLANSPVQRSRRLVGRAIRRSSPWAVQARYLLERSGHSLSDQQRKAATAVCEPGLKGVRLRTRLWKRRELHAASPAQDSLLLATLLMPLSRQVRTTGGFR